MHTSKSLSFNQVCIRVYQLYRIRKLKFLDLYLMPVKIALYIPFDMVMFCLIPNITDNCLFELIFFKFSF